MTLEYTCRFQRAIGRFSECHGVFRVMSMKFWNFLEVSVQRGGPSCFKGVSRRFVVLRDIQRSFRGLKKHFTIIQTVSAHFRELIGF